MDQPVHGHPEEVHRRPHPQLRYLAGVVQLIVAVGLDHERAAAAQGSGDGPDAAVLDGTGRPAEQPVVGQEIGEHQLARVAARGQVLLGEARPTSLDQQRQPQPSGGLHVDRQRGAGVRERLAAEGKHQRSPIAEAAQLLRWFPASPARVLVVPEARHVQAGVGLQLLHVGLAEVGAARQDHVPGIQPGFGEAWHRQVEAQMSEGAGHELLVHLVLPQPPLQPGLSLLQGSRLPEAVGVHGDGEPGDAGGGVASRGLRLRLEGKDMGSVVDGEPSQAEAVARTSEAPHC